MFHRKIDWLVLFMVVLKCSELQPATLQNNWIIWNIGQGQWITHVLNDECLHYDVGGELGTYKRIEKDLLKKCGSKMNAILITHWDMDHFLNLLPLVRQVPKVCWLSLPENTFNKKMVQQILDLSISPCLFRPVITIWRPQNFKTTNESSAVVQDSLFLIPGDSPLKSEKTWVFQYNAVDPVKILILGHHGSATSTGVELLQHFKNLKMAIASARYAKYHHPHRKTLLRLKKEKIPVIKTEDWGNIKIAD